MNKQVKNTNCHFDNSNLPRPKLRIRHDRPLVGGEPLNPRNEYTRGIILVLVAGLFASTSGVMLRQIDTATEWQILFYRSLSLSLLIATVIVLRSRRNLITALMNAGGPILAGALCMVVIHINVVFALYHSTIASAVFLFSAAPVIAAVLGWVVLGERPRRTTWIAILVALLGVGIMVIEGLLTGNAIGSGAALVVAVASACYSVVLRRGKAFDMLPAVCLSSFITTVVSCTFAMSLGHGLQLSANDTFYSVAIGAISISMASILYVAGSRHVPAAELLLFVTIEVVLAPIWVWVVINEVPSTWTLVGGIIVLTGVTVPAIAQIARSRYTRRAVIGE